MRHLRIRAHSSTGQVEGAARFLHGLAVQTVDGLPKATSPRCPSSGTAKATYRHGQHPLHSWFLLRSQRIAPNAASGSGRSGRTAVFKFYGLRDNLPVLGDQAYGDNTDLRARLDQAGSEYVLSIGAGTGVFGPETVFAVAKRRTGRGRPPSALHPDRPHETVEALARRLGLQSLTTIAFGSDPTGTKRSSRFACVRVSAAHPVLRDHHEPRAEWLIIEWPEGAAGPSDYWISNLPEDATSERLAHLARLRWMIELDYRQLGGELGLDHYEGRSYAGWHHHTALVTTAHAFLTEERLDPKAPRPA